jgi:enoyl-CoA hydratase/carnithine racemase
MAYDQILVEQRGSVAVLTLNRPERLNAWTPRMTVEMTAAITDAEQDASIGAVVVTGAGRGFCAGADIGGEFAAKLDDRGTEAGRRHAGEPAPAGDWVRFCRATLPLVAAINGPAIGIGLTMVLPFDRLVAARSAKLSARFVKMGLVPELASSHFLVARCGWGAASWLALSGTTVQGEEAFELGLVDRVVDDDQVLDAAIADAAELAANPAPQLRMIKELLTANATEGDYKLVQERELEALEVAYTTPEHREAVQAFLEKRPPNFAR